ncbi:MAG: hypothetical protein ONB44_24750 [candidate division KSB1 bacterium]|nr:hypothetical protein [candidate division KSB1 bacterium]MDZ7305345.1 hypothetical protein [candidate division KSB1 bacterium]MDZ7312026.1 hypothetical protein [candidate division KSB1 bacterium]
MPHRLETFAGAADSLGGMQVPNDKYYVAQTVRSLISTAGTRGDVFIFLAI